MGARERGKERRKLFDSRIISLVLTCSSDLTCSCLPVYCTYQYGDRM